MPGNNVAELCADANFDGQPASPAITSECACVCVCVTSIASSASASRARQTGVIRFIFHGVTDIGICKQRIGGP
eukprot:121872-Chlamydomonas_euryale.AAC.1